MHRSRNMPTVKKLNVDQFVCKYISHEEQTDKVRDFNYEISILFRNGILISFYVKLFWWSKTCQSKSRKQYEGERFQS